MLDWDQAEKRRKEREQAEEEEREEAARLECETAEEREREFKLQRTEIIIQGLENALEAYRHYP